MTSPLIAFSRVVANRQRASRRSVRAPEAETRSADRQFEEFAVVDKDFLEKDSAEQVPLWEWPCSKEERGASEDSSVQEYLWSLKEDTEVRWRDEGERTDGIFLSY